MGKELPELFSLCLVVLLITLHSVKYVTIVRNTYHIVVAIMMNRESVEGRYRISSFQYKKSVYGWSGNIMWMIQKTEWQCRFWYERKKSWMKIILLHKVKCLADNERNRWEMTIQRVWNCSKIDRYTALENISYLKKSRHLENCSLGIIFVYLCIVY